jgi:hypothetical protein
MRKPLGPSPFDIAESTFRTSIATEIAAPALDAISKANTDSL